MRPNHIAAFVVSMVLFLGLFGALARASELSDLYNRAKETLGSREKIILATGASRLVVWQSQSPRELMVMSITGLRGNRENFSSSFLAYSISEAGIFSTSMYQCSWREQHGKIVYECGEGMKFPKGIREAASDELIRELDSILKTSDNLISQR